MNWINISNIASILTIFGFVVTLATLIFLFYQCQILKSTLKIQSFQNLFTNIINIDMFFANNPSITQYVYGKKDLPSDTESQEYLQVMSACEMVLDHFLEAYGCKNIMNKDMWLGWQMYMKKTYKDSNSLRHYVQMNHDYFGEQFIEMLVR
ncbi:hypothetical protein [Anaeromicropila herbilytica]|uniref:Uncharacterized protein n=1 Tax=Anaeromicropila herbilytica TaxID=2785025 RepID=A0A7R7EM59_9FIRM|nr:hypothetical protein [Anaeromicropila herbilytica]BCN31052.1 hypothetical protein bsdtb5_23470 [Anaeromicropila herbilytica]